MLNPFKIIDILLCVLSFTVIEIVWFCVQRKQRK